MGLAGWTSTRREPELGPTPTMSSGSEHFSICYTYTYNAAGMVTMLSITAINVPRTIPVFADGQAVRDYASPGSKSSRRRMPRNPIKWEQNAGVRLKTAESMHGQGRSCANRVPPCWIISPTIGYHVQSWACETSKRKCFRVEASAQDQ